MEYVLLIFVLLVLGGSICFAVSHQSYSGGVAPSVRRGNITLGNNRGFVSPMEIGMFGEEAAYAAIDVSKLDVKSFGRRRGAFGKWGYCVTNPVCINGMDKNLQRYISHLFYENCRVESYDTEEVYSVSLFDKPVYKISLLMKGSHEVVSLYFIDSTYENHEIFPDGFSDYAVYLKKQKTEEERKMATDRRVNDVRFSLKNNNFYQDSPSPIYVQKRGGVRVSLRDEEHRYDKQCSLELYEKSKKGTAEIKSIWKK